MIKMKYKELNSGQRLREGRIIEDIMQQEDYTTSIDFEASLI